MSYDLRIAVKIEGYDGYADIAYPEYDSPTYNLSKMFRACMDWDYKQGEYYPCSKYAEKLATGVSQLTWNRELYEKYNPPNGWGDIDSAIEALRSWWIRIQEIAEDIPIEHLYMRW